MSRPADTSSSTHSAAPGAPALDEGRMLRLLAAAGVGLAGVLGASLLLALLGGWLTAAVSLVDPADWLRQAVPWLASVLDGFSFLADIGRNAGWALLPAVAVALLIRRLQGLAGFVAVTAAGAVLLGETGALVAVAWHTGEGSQAATTPDPVYDDVLGLTVTAAVGVLVLLPVLSAAARRWLVTTLAVIVVAFGVLAVLSGFGTLIAVVGGWLVGASWTAVAVVAYRRFAVGPNAEVATDSSTGPSDRLRDRGVDVDTLRDRGAEDPRALQPAPARDRVPVHGVRGVLLLVLAALLIAGTVLGIGLLLITPSAAIQRLDEAIIDWIVGTRTPELTAAATIIDAMGNTAGILAVHLAAIPISLALTRHRAPSVFLVAALVGETAIYLGTGAIVGRDRPEVDHLTMGVPVTSGYPSGHVAASLVTYCGIALLVIVWSRSRWRHAALPVAVLLVLGVVWARLYWGMHYPTDTLVSLAFGAAWLAVCWWVIRPDRGSGAPPDSGVRRTAQRGPFDELRDRAA
ncbi:phosphatase PAP2 family protein [Lysobacter korlensis]|uniref:Phosphatase PAP2 family protein n=1 Tax=Lysobacter korlensis TaxID=553636 RepID=A0ABV6S0S4_9GAMM